MTVATPAHKLRKLWLSIGWLLIAFVVYLSLVPHLPMQINVIAGDKLEHAFAYATLMLWFLQLYSASRRPFIALSLIGMGILLEILQGFTPDRDPDYLDAVANTAGVLLAWLLGKTRLSKTLAAVENALAPSSRYG